MVDSRSAAYINSETSFSNTLRNRRFNIFKKLVSKLPRPINIVDIGGTESWWAQRGWAGKEGINITAVNLEAADTKYDNIKVVKGDATDLSEYADDHFDVAFSNSVIEHLYTLDNQYKMASEVQRIAKAYWVQTPNYWFPIEPHFRVFCWQWLPRNTRVAILRRWRCGWRGPCDNLDDAQDLVDEVRLMKQHELQKAFPDGIIWKERIFGIVKSMVLYHGFDD